MNLLELQKKMDSKNRNKNGAGKGDRPRKLDMDKYWANFDRIFKKNCSKKK